MRQLLLLLPLAMILIGTVSAVTVTMPSTTSYGGAYWQYPSVAYTEFRFADSNIYSCTAGSNSGFTWTANWGDGSSNGGIWTAGYQYVNGYIVVVSGQRCNAGYSLVSAGNGGPAVGYSTDGSPNLYVFHPFDSYGRFTISDTDSFGGGSTTLYVYQSPSVSFSISGGDNWLDLGSSLHFSAYSNCGSGTYCADITYPGQAGTGIVSSPYSATPSYTPGGTGAQTGHLCSYDPVASGSTCSSTVNFVVFPR